MSDDILLPPKQPNKQLRGDALIKYLATWISYLQWQSRTLNTKFVLNVSELSKYSGVTRKTINRQMEKISIALGEAAPLSIRKRDGSKTIAQLQNKIKNTQNEKKELEKTLAIYQEHLIGVYDALSNNPSCWEARVLLEVFHKDFKCKNKFCPLCGLPSKP